MKEPQAMDAAARARCDAAYWANRQEAIDAQQIRQAARGDTSAWRRGRLARYRQQVLRLSGAERLAFFNSHPLSNIFD